jgi:hypothetical protein
VMTSMRGAISVRARATGFRLECSLIITEMIPIRRADTRSELVFTQALARCSIEREMILINPGLSHRAAAMTAPSACSGTTRGMTATAQNGSPREAAMIPAEGF